MSHIDDEAFRRWEADQHPSLKSDGLWRYDAYKLAAYLVDLVREDLRRVRGTDYARTKDQLRAAAASVGANFAEGYGRPTPKDRIRFYSYSLGSARECTWWYASLRDPLGDELVFARYELLAQLRRLLMGILKAAQERSGNFTFRP